LSLDIVDIPEPELEWTPLETRKPGMRE